jgi:outer membrane lipoprotein-sorting protein/peroxiredoxin
MNMIKHTAIAILVFTAGSMLLGAPPAQKKPAQEPAAVRKAFDAIVTKLDSVSCYQGEYTVSISSMKGDISQSGSFAHKLPYSFRCHEKTSAMGGIMNVEELTVCNGSNGWEVSMAPNGTIVNVSRWGLASMEDIFYAFFNKSQFMMLSHDRSNTFFMLRHDILFDSVKQQNGDTVFTGKTRTGSQRFAAIYRVASSMGSDGISNYVPRNVELRVNKAGIPIELTQYNMKGVPIIHAVMNSVKVNPSLADSLFSYSPPKGIQVLNMDKAMNQEPMHVPHPLLNKQAPEINVTYLSGKPKQITPGKIPIVLTFFASWSKNCRGYMTRIEKLYQEYAGKNVQFVSVTDQQDLETVKKYRKESRLTLPIYSDTSRKILKDFQVQIVPKTIIINSNGIIIDVLEGNPPGIEAEIKKSIEKAR